MLFLTDMRNFASQHAKETTLKAKQAGVAMVSAT